MIKSNRKDGKMYLCLPELSRTDKSEIRQKLVEVIRLFHADKLFVKLSFSCPEMESFIKDVLGVKDAVLHERKSRFSSEKIAYFLLEQTRIAQLAELSKRGDVMIELYFLKEGTEHELSQAEKNFEANICISDNDGPFLVFDRNLYDPKEILSKVKRIAEMP